MFAGGGHYKAMNDPIAEQVREIIRPAVEGLSNICDSDCIAEFESMHNILYSIYFNLIYYFILFNNILYIILFCNV